MQQTNAFNVRLGDGGRPEPRGRRGEARARGETGGGPSHGGDGGRPEPRGTMGGLVYSGVKPAQTSSVLIYHQISIGYSAMYKVIIL